ncbi:histidine kinase [Cellulomonas biazotea]|uniref:Histidine kinase n=1 Tax=Cellulomonas biazotea TaxID=1709 RepID=A0A402DTQ1_9CELL|nr:histidine kinase [Cellulomonas biazotea]
MARTRAQGRRALPGTPPYAPNVGRGGRDDGLDAQPDAGLDALMDAVVSMSTDLDIATVLDRLVAAGRTLTGASYGALGVLGPHGGLQEFVHSGLDAATVARIGDLPQGRGVLGAVVASPHPLRLHDVADCPASVGFPPHHPQMRTFLGVPVRARGAVFGNLYLTDKRGGADFTARDEQVAVALAASAGVALEHARAYRQVREHERWLEQAAACTAALTSGRPLEEAVAEVGALVRAATGAAAAHLHVRADDLPTGVADDLSGRAPVVRRLPDGTVLGVPGDAWALLVPLRSGERWVGGLTAGWPADTVTGATAGRVHTPGPPDDLASVAGFGEQLALALDVAGAQGDRARLAVLEERERIARDLHDMVIQRLFAIGLDVQGAAQDAVRPDVARRLGTAVDDLDETIKDVRTTIFRLGTRGAEAGRGLRHRIDAEVVAARRGLGFVPHLRTDGVTATVPDDVADDAVAVVREALANVARHARAHEVVVRVQVGTDLVVEVQDDGVGIPPDADRSGLANVAGRAASRGGTSSAAALPEGGSLVRWSVPLP